MYNTIAMALTADQIKEMLQGVNKGGYETFNLKK